MRLESKIRIRRAPEEVSRFLANLGNIPKWDRGVAQVRATSAAVPGVGFEFETVGYGERQDRGRMAYRVTETGPDHCVVALTSSGGNARFFRTAQWVFSIQPDVDGTWLTCAAEFTLRLRYIVLAPILWAKRSAIQADLESLKCAIEAAGGAS
jgi:hypothetical protein